MKLNAGIKRSWLVTGGAGFIGSHIVSALLYQKQKVIVFDNFVNSHFDTLRSVIENTEIEDENDIKIYKYDIRDYGSCLEAMQGVDIVLHQAALASVPESIQDPLTYHQVNVGGFENILESARQAGVKRVVYASSSAVYGGDKTIPKVEDIIAKPLSPYAATKQINEVQAQIYQTNYGLETIGLRYFNVYGSRQNPSGAYASVIPKWICSIINNQPCVVYGDGETTRDFCHVSDVVLANLLAGTVSSELALGQVYNIGLGENINLNKLFKILTKSMSVHLGKEIYVEPNYQPFRQGDIQHSLSNISKAKDLLGYTPKILLEEGLHKTISWYMKK